MTKRIKGYLCVAAAAALYGLNPIAAKYAYAGGAVAIDLVLMRGASLAPLALFAFWLRPEDMRIPRGRQAFDIGVLAVMGLFLTPMLLFSSYSYISSGAATSLHYVYCVLTLLICVLFYRDRFDWIKAVCVVLCVAGVFMIYAPGEGGAALGVVFALASALTFAVYAVYMDKSGLHAMSPVKLQFYSLCISGPLTLVYAIATGTLSLKMNAPAWGVTLLFFMLGSCVAGILFQRGVHYIGPQRAAILSTIEPLTSAVLGILLLSEKLSWRAGIGMAAILVAAALVAAVDGIRERRRPTEVSQ